MRSVDLPVLPADTSLETALATMYARGRSGVLTIKGNDVILVHARGVLDALESKKKVLLGKITDSVKISTKLAPLQHVSVYDHTWKVATSSGSGLEEIEGMRDVQLGIDSMETFEGHFASYGEPFALAELGIGNAVVISVSERYGDPLMAGPKPCRCSDDSTPHYYKKPHPAVCSFDQTKINC